MEKGNAANTSGLDKIEDILLQLANQSTEYAEKPTIEDQRDTQEFVNTGSHGNQIYQVTVYEVNDNKTPAKTTVTADLVSSTDDLQVKSESGRDTETFNRDVFLNTELPTLFKCGVCENKSFSDVNELILHMKLEHSFPCKLCDRVFVDRSSLLLHSQTHPKNVDNMKNYKKGTLQKDKIKKYTCSICNKKFGRKYSLRVHMATHSVTAPFKCEDCGDEFKWINSYIRHRRRVHLNERPFVCDICGDAFLMKNDLSSHRKRHDVTLTSENKKYKCHLCGVQYEYGPYLIDHLRLHTQEKILKCSICHVEFEKESRFRWHISKHARELSVNGQPIAKNCVATKKKNFFRTGDPVMCDYCGKTFSSQAVLQLHTRKHTGERPYKCKICPERFALKHRLMEHLRYHTGEKPFECWQCQEKFMFNRDLKRHCLLKHETKRPYKCFHCDKEFVNACDIQRHSIKHSSEIPFRCPYCNRGFKWQKSLSMHVLTHTGEKPFKCDICGKSFRKSQVMKSHRNTHTGHKQYKCEICGKEFNWAKSMSRHKLLHTGKKPHKCIFCDKAFTQSHLLSKHILIHTGNAPHKCEVCLKEFSTWGLLKEHAKLHIPIGDGNTQILDHSYNTNVEIIEIPNIQSNVNEVVVESYDQGEIEDQGHFSPSQVLGNSDDIKSANEDQVPFEDLLNEVSNQNVQVHQVEATVVDIAETLSLPEITHNTVQTFPVDSVQMLPTVSTLNNSEEIQVQVLQHISHGSSEAYQIRKPKIVNNKDEVHHLIEPSHDSNQGLPVFNASNVAQIYTVSDVISQDSLEKFNGPVVKITHNAKQNDISKHPVDKISHDSVSQLENNQLDNFPQNVAQVQPIDSASQNSTEDSPADNSSKNSEDIHPVANFSKNSTEQHSYERSTQNSSEFHKTQSIGFTIIQNTKSNAVSKNENESNNASHQHAVCDKKFTCSIVVKNDKPKSKDDIKKGTPCTCTICDQVCPTKNGLIRHMRLHTGEKPYKCKFCKKAYVWEKDLKRHVMVAHERSKLFKCLICNKEFSDATGLKSHSVVHVDIMPYVCEICGKRYKWKNCLTVHLRTHTGEKIHQCLLCDKYFSGASVLKSHMSTHTGQKLYKCNVCDMTFAWEKSLSRHLLTHSGIKMYKCSKCDKSFTQSGTLNKHMKTHSNEIDKDEINSEHNFSLENLENVHLQAVSEIPDVGNCQDIFFDPESENLSTPSDNSVIYYVVYDNVNQPSTEGNVIDLPITLNSDVIIAKQ